MKLQFKRFFSVDSPKAIKAKKFRYLNAINYMAPHKSLASAICARMLPLAVSCFALVANPAKPQWCRASDQLDQQCSRLP